MKVLVTGASGFLGRHVVDQLLSRGHQVRALVRPGREVATLEWGEQVEVVKADLRARAGLDRAFEGVDALVHLAAFLDGSPEEIFAGTVVGTEHLFDAMSRSGTKRVVLASSFSVYDWSRARGRLTEDSPLENSLYRRDGYAIAKFWQERVVRRMSQAHGFDLVVLRPGFIWGRGNEYLAGIGYSLGRMHIVFGGIRRRLPVTHVENCAACFVEVMENPKALGHTFNVVDGEGASAWKYMGEYIGRSPRVGVRIPVPYSLAAALVRVAYSASTLVLGRDARLPGMMIPSRFEARFKPLEYGDWKLRRVLGWRPPLSFDECLDRTYG